jgi:tRNA modification GTPase
MDTIFALSSGRPPAAVAVIRISGPNAHEAGRLIGSVLPPPRTAAVRELRHPQSGELLDEVLLLRFDGPASATGEDIVELHCHGGRAVIDSIRSALELIDGLRQAEPGEFTRRSFENGRIDLTGAEGLADLLEAETEAQRKAAIALAEGGLSKQIRLWEEKMLGLSARAERAIDYDDEDELGVDSQMIRDCADLEAELRAWLERPRIEALKDGVRVVVAGPPNAGKSSLINAIAGTERAIVTDVPGTTRDHIEVPLSLAGLPILLTDTAGLRQTTDAVEAIGVARASTLVDLSDILLWMGDPADAPPHKRVIKVHGRADLPGRRTAPASCIAVSSKTGEGISDLLATITSLLSELVPTQDAISLNRRQANLIGDAANHVAVAISATDAVLFAEELRSARLAFDQLTGRAGIEDVLDALFGRFCLGK